VNSPGSLPEAFFIAKAGDSYVGQSNLIRSEELSDVLYTEFTGVRREHRGRGIAMALKLRAIDYAKRHGYREIRTWNSSLNAPMLGINVKLGFVKQPLWITFGKDLTKT
jgi:GNAT superfamily N-acetyltransferase